MSAPPDEARNNGPKDAGPGSGSVESPAEGRTGASKEFQVAYSGVPGPLATPSKDAHLSSGEEGSSSTDKHGAARGAPNHSAPPGRYSCNNDSCSSQENLTTWPTEQELAVARNLIQENLTRSQAMDRMAEIQFHDLRRPQQGGHRSSPAVTKPN